MKCGGPARSEVKEGTFRVLAPVKCDATGLPSDQLGNFDSDSTTNIIHPPTSSHSPLFLPIYLLSQEHPWRPTYGKTYTWRAFPRL